MALLVFHGQDTYRSHQKLKELRERFADRFGSSGRMRVWDPSTFLMEEVRDAARGRSLFGGTAFLVVKNPFQNAEILDALSLHLDLFCASSESLVVLLFQEGEIVTKHPIWNEILSRGSVQEFRLLKGSQLLSWIVKECVRYGCSIRNDAAEYLARWAGEDLWILANEIRKISLAVLASSRKEIQREDVASFVKISQEYNAFAMLEAALAGKKSEALRLLSSLFSQGEHALRVYAAIGHQIRTLLLVASMMREKIPPGQMARVGGIPPFLLQKSLRLCRGLSLPRLSMLHARLSLMDINAKTGRDNPESSLFIFLSFL